MVLYQDLKERQVFWFLFPIIGLCASILLYNNLLEPMFLITIIINQLFILMLIAILFLYSKFKLKTKLSHTFGLGDTLMFFALGFTFSSLSFIVLFIFSLIFSLILHLVLKSKFSNRTVPLAGYMSAFFTLTYVGHWLDIVPNPYAL